MEKEEKLNSLDNATLHMLGYLSAEHWIDAYENAKEIDIDPEHILQLANIIDRRYGTNFAKILSERMGV